MTVKPLEKMIEFYRPQYSDDTAALFAAMLKPAEKLALINPFLPTKKVLSAIGFLDEKIIAGQCFYRVPQTSKPRLIDGLLSHYFLDMSSLFPALLLPINPDMQVLDMCSAPGGKLLVMISRLIKNVVFTANDSSSARAFRLKGAVQQFLPAEVLSQIKLSIKDATFFGLKKPASYDAILLDAPCSSEAHVVNDPKLLAQFSGLKKNLPIRQYSLLSAALLALRPGGHVMYATCSINKNENDDVIKKICQKKGPDVQVIFLKAPGIITDFGMRILPHLHDMGPAYFSLLRKIR